MGAWIRLIYAWSSGTWLILPGFQASVFVWAAAGPGHCPIPVASGVVCNTCKDTITGCRGGTDCPLLKTLCDDGVVDREVAASCLIGA